VNNAGVFAGGPIDKIKTEDWDNVIATNLRAPFLCTRAAFRIMKAQGGGRIINIGSISASRVRQYNAPYSSAKFGLMGLTHTTALEGKEFNITCGILNPGNVERDNAPPAGTGWNKEPKMSQEEIAAAAVYMASQPPHVNVLEIIQLHKDQLYLGRG
jgi:NAD(P)-dependent dehydrogenase (short-subunit alcohol dehydrogenase family)